MRINSRCREPTCGGCCRRWSRAASPAFRTDRTACWSPAQFRDAVETCYAAMFETILRTIDRYRSAEAAA